MKYFVNFAALIGSGVALSLTTQDDPNVQVNVNVNVNQNSAPAAAKKSSAILGDQRLGGNAHGQVSGDVHESAENSPKAPASDAAPEDSQGDGDVAMVWSGGVKSTTVVEPLEYWQKLKPTESVMGEPCAPWNLTDEKPCNIGIGACRDYTCPIGKSYTDKDGTVKTSDDNYGACWGSDDAGYDDLSAWRCLLHRVLKPDGLHWQECGQSILSSLINDNHTVINEHDDKWIIPSLAFHDDACYEKTGGVSTTCMHLAAGRFKVNGKATTNPRYWRCGIPKCTCDGVNIVASVGDKNDVGFDSFGQVEKRTKLIVDGKVVQGKYMTLCGGNTDGCIMSEKVADEPMQVAGGSGLTQTYQE